MREGTCAICGKHGRLTAEHIPPRRAFNSFPLLAMKMDQAVEQTTGNLPWAVDRPVKDRHVYSLCERCNNRTGSWYGTDYCEFVKMAADSEIPPDKQGNLTFEGRPAAVAKEAMACLCSTVGPGLAKRHTEIRRLILNNKYRSSHPGFRLWLYLTVGEGGHQTGLATKINASTHQAQVVAEFSHWPVGWVFSWQDTELPPLCEITHWLDMEYGRRQVVTITVPRLWTVTGFPLDYRTPEQVAKDYRENIMQQRGLTR
jgi:hypothetical protein